MKGTITFTKIQHDINGNPRYVCHFLNLVSDLSKDDLRVGEQYAIACKRANRIDGRKYSTKAYGGGIVFQCNEYDLRLLCQQIAVVSNSPLRGYRVV